MRNDYFGYICIIFNLNYFQNENPNRFAVVGSRGGCHASACAAVHDLGRSLSSRRLACGAADSRREDIHDARLRQVFPARRTRQGNAVHIYFGCHTGFAAESQSARPDHDPSDRPVDGLSVADNAGGDILARNGIRICPCRGRGVQGVGRRGAAGSRHEHISQFAVLAQLRVSGRRSLSCRTHGRTVCRGHAVDRHARLPETLSGQQHRMVSSTLQLDRGRAGDTRNIYPGVCGRHRGRCGYGHDGI